MEASEMFLRFRKGWAGINASYEQYARQLGISYSLLQVICELYGSGQDMTQKDICEACHLPKTTVNAIVSRLVKQGYAELKGMPEDKRQKAVHLTREGKKYVSPIMEHMAASEARAFEVLDEKTARVMVEGVEAYQRRFNEGLNKEDGGK